MFDAEKIIAGDDRFNWYFDDTLLAKTDRTLKEHTDDTLGNGKILFDLGYIDGKTAELLALALFFHDSGKANGRFQARITVKKDGSFKKFNPAEELPHQIISAAHWLAVAEKYLAAKEEINRVFYAIWQHHPRIAFLELAKNDIGIVNDKIGTDVPSYFPLAEIHQSKVNKIDGKFRRDAEFIRLTGLVRHCDHTASAGLPSEYENDFLLNALDGFFADKKYSRNALQKFCAENTDRNIIAVAPVGSGKTEAGLYWLDDRKGFFVLPLRTAINAMFDRAKNIVAPDAGDKSYENKIGLLHSGTSEAYADIKNDNFNNDNEEENVFDYCRRTKNLTLPLTITTPDQLFSFVFRGRHYEQIFAVLTYSKIIIDEIQSYSADLLAFIIYGLSEIQKAGAGIAIITATLPPFVADFLRAAMPQANFVEKQFTPNEQSPRHFVHVENTELTAAPVIHSFGKKPKRILVICNTIKKAQEIYDEIKNADQSLPIQMLHSKFIRRDRKKKEVLISANDIKPVIWIATSLVEASLDIDYDELHTELQDLSSLFQRMGRCNRHYKIVPKEANCFIYLQISEKILTTDDNPQRGFIDETIYALSRDALLSLVGNDGFLTERQKENLIDETLTTENIRNSRFAGAYRDAMTEARNMVPNSFNPNGHFRNIDSVSVIPLGVYEENKELIDDCETELNRLRRESLRKSMKEISERVNVLNEFVLDIPGYFVRGKNRRRYVKKTIGISKYNSIIVFDCDYDDEKGFGRKAVAADGAKSDNADDNLDAYMF